MKPIIKFLFICAIALCLLASCTVLPAKQCYCKGYANGKLKIETTADLVVGNCSSLNYTTINYVNDETIVHETICEEMF